MGNYRIYKYKKFFSATNQGQDTTQKSAETAQFNEVMAELVKKAEKNVAVKSETQDSTGEIF